MNYQLSLHAQEQIEQREIPLAMVESVLVSPQQLIPQSDGTKVYQSQLDWGKGKIYLLRLVVRDELEPWLVVTVYKTSKISKYWRTP
ncbi:MAG: DUF4258 domain-containing protein [Microcystis novacekii Mn_MB_F_20050700_S1]|uniref:DUF4258 domain-containing protein n=2 Tax=Microcystis TaxID=1125 RepID=A0A552IEE7_9CHRO|nr:DUF4258 domain-containing protein [Microcystis aeruginosa W11-03]NCR93397.1 DUF4258 domain-containing protein [Microcystis aeruginosa W11-06]TRU81808.1 MAG: DUF4258 domain-containing protein [Microcystis novacekii Mn_MB_F_20050700_S1D]TRU82791.1 MAG: DUF4258 domain-containing protein [Microcystis novacekii Mn_MB_F_20050700_S1]TRU95231.1 MAG: DUF4258 domain-containing protein [Microcystis wesenbergii Mw_QC_B_20070930_S4D]TRU98982.1 MAG: DUF4258 domain-containing protein [Microcystis wesenber